jgi:prepilin peptidase CpaA
MLPPATDTVILQACGAVFALALATAALTDLRSRTIPNAIPLVLMAAFPIAAWAAGMSAGQMAWHLAAGAAGLGVAAGLFAVRAWGGGDAKLAATAALWLGFAPLPRFVLVMALTGGGLALIMLLTQGRRARIPYGIAIAAAGLDWWAVALLPWGLS